MGGIKSQGRILRYAVVLTVLYGSMISAQSPESFKVNDSTRFYISGSKEISKEAFKKAMSSYDYLAFGNLIDNIVDVVKRVNLGKLKKVQTLRDSLNAIVPEPIDWDKPLMVFYDQGINNCNRKGSESKKIEHTKSRRIRRFDKNIKKKFGNLPIRLHQAGLDSVEHRISDYSLKDPDAIFQGTFFKYHYPCYSFVIIHKQYYYSVLGEFTLSQIDEGLQAVLELEGKK